MNMDTPRGLTRRQFLESMAVVLSAVAVRPGVAWASLNDSPHWLQVVRELADAREMVDIGNAYLKGSGNGANVASLVTALRHGALHAVRDDMQPVEIERLLECAIREDFAADRIAVVEGWWLGETEAQVCALAALMR